MDDLDEMVLRAEAGDTALWEDIARRLLKKRKPVKKPKIFGGQTWAHVVLSDGREYLTSAYGRAKEADTLSAHAEYAQYRGRMEDSGDNGGAIKRVFLNRSVLPTPVKSCELLQTVAQIDAMRDYCFTQRGLRQGWL